MAKLRESVLPDGTRIACLQPREIPFLWEEMPMYFRHGISVKQGDIVFDVGANIGLFGLCAQRLAQGKVSIYSFEPIPDIFAALHCNAQRFDPNNWKVFACGLARHGGAAVFAYHPHATVWSTAFPDDSPAARAAVKEVFLRNLAHLPRPFGWMHWLPRILRSLVLDFTIHRAFHIRRVECCIRTMSQIVREHAVPRIDLLKIDVERAETDVLAGIGDEDWPKIRQVVVEVHEAKLRLRMVADLLQKKGFTSLTVEQELALQGTDIVNLYAIR